MDKRDPEDAVKVMFLKPMETWSREKLLEAARSMYDDWRALADERPGLVTKATFHDLRTHERDEAREERDRAHGLIMSMVRALRRDEEDPLDASDIQGCVDAARFVRADRDEERALREKLSGILTATANGFRGVPAPPVLAWDWSDLPTRAQTARRRIGTIAEMAKSARRVFDEMGADGLFELLAAIGEQAEES